MATQSKKIILTIVRHGAKDANKQGIAHGSTDTPLNSLGLRQAKGKLINQVQSSQKGLQISLSRTRAGPGRTGKQEQEQTTYSTYRL